jgi:DNA-binding beta-propeller fold protein YncE
MRRIPVPRLVFGAAALLLGSCAANDKSASGANARAPTGNAGIPGTGGTTAFGGGAVPAGGGAGAGGTGAADAGASGAPPVLPPEMQVKLDFELPQASERFVYAANPKGGTVSIIDAQTQQIQTLETGDQPTFLRTLAGTDDAIVLNVGSSDATIMRDPANGATTSTVPVGRGANAIAVAPDGKHAVVYFDPAYTTAGNGSGSFQDVTVLSLAAGNDTATGMTVGFSPRAVAFRSDGSMAYVVTDDGVSVLDFTDIEKHGTGIARLVSLGPNVDQKGLDVSVTPDGKYALTREPGKSVVRLVSLDSGDITSLELAAVLPAPADSGDADAGPPPVVVPDVSDLALAPTGAFALAVVRNQNIVLQIPVPGGFQDTTRIETHTIDASEIVGLAEISPQADRALLYSTVADTMHITILTLDGSTPPKTVALRKTVQAVAIAPGGDTALIVHNKDPGDPNDPTATPDQMLARSYGYSVLRISTGDVKLQVTSSAPGAFSIVPDGSYLFLLFRDDASGVREVQKIESKSFLVQPIELGSPPISLGSVPGSKQMFVNQDHPDGRITFINWDTNETRTVTGFELNSRIRD